MDELVFHMWHASHQIHRCQDVPACNFVYAKLIHEKQIQAMQFEFYFSQPADITKQDETRTELDENKVWHVLLMASEAIIFAVCISKWKTAFQLNFKSLWVDCLAVAMS